MNIGTVDTNRNRSLFLWGLLIAFVGIIILGIFTFIFLSSSIGNSQYHGIEPDEREIWRNLEFSRVGRFESTGDVLMLEGWKDNDCFCVYAFNKFTGEKLWDTEELAAPHIKKYVEEGPSDTRIEGVVDIIRLDEELGIVFLIINYESIYALNPLNGEVIWSTYYELFDRMISDRNIFIFNEDFSLAALDRATGKEIWTIPDFVSSSDYDALHNTPWFNYDYDDGILEMITSLDDGDIIQRYNPDTGEMIEEIKESQFYSVSTTHEGDVYSYTSFDYGRGSMLSVVNQQTEEVKWEIKFDVYPHYTYPPKFQNDLLYILLDSLQEERADNRWVGEILAIEPESGEIVWHFNKDYKLASLYNFLGEDHMFVAAEIGAVFSLDLLTGEVLWSKNLPNRPTEYFVFEDYYVITTELNRIYAIDMSTGDIRWQFYEPIEITDEFGGEPFIYGTQPSIAMADDIMLVSTDEPYLRALDLVSGQELWSWSNGKVPGEAFYHRHDIELVDGDLVFVSQKGNIFVFDISNLP